MSNRLRRNLIVALSAALFLADSVALPNDEWIPLDAERLPKLIKGAPVIVVAEFKGSKAIPNFKYYENLHFRIVRTLKGDTQVKSVLVPVPLTRYKRQFLHKAKRVILFLKKGSPGKLKLAGRYGFLRVLGDDAVKEVEQYITLRRDQFNVKNGRQAYRSFLIDKVATSKSHYFRENMAQDLGDMIFGFRIAGVQRPELKKQDLAAISKAALSEKSYSVATRLCFILEALGSDKTDDCILHALVNTSVEKSSRQLAGISRQLAGVIAKRDQLVDRLLLKLEDMKDVKESGRFYFVFNHVSLVPDAKLLPGLRRLWEKNPQARMDIKRVLNSGENWKRRVLLRELEPLSGSTPLQQLKLADHVVLARYVKNESMPRTFFAFEVDRAIKPTKIPRSFKILSESFMTVRINKQAHQALSRQIVSGKPVLLMLKQDEKGAYAVLHALDEKSVKEGLDSLVPTIERYLKITTLKDKPYADAMKAFVFEGLKHEDGTIFKQGAAFELAELFKNHRKLFTIDDKELEQLIAVILQSKDSRVAFPMCYALSQGGESTFIDDACLHTITEIPDELRGMYELYSAVAKRKSLRSKLFNKALKEKDARERYLIIDHLTGIPQQETVRGLEKIWKQNKAARRAILFYSTRLSKEDQELFGRLTEFPLKKWTDNKGKIIAEARLVKYRQGWDVLLKTAGGGTIYLLVDKLSKADQQYVKELFPDLVPEKPSPEKPSPK